MAKKTYKYLPIYKRWTNLRLTSKVDIAEVDTPAAIVVIEVRTNQLIRHLPTATSPKRRTIHIRSTKTRKISTANTSMDINMAEASTSVAVIIRVEEAALVDAVSASSFAVAFHASSVASAKKR